MSKMLYCKNIFCIHKSRHSTKSPTPNASNVLTVTHKQFRAGAHHSERTSDSEQEFQYKRINCAQGVCELF